MSHLKWILEASRVFHAAAAFLIAVTSRAEALALTARDIYTDRSHAVVYISSTTGTNVAETGTGSVVSSSGLVVTNAHVLEVKGRPATRIRVFFKPASISGDLSRDLTNAVDARVVAKDDALDLAVLQLPTGRQYPALPLASEPLQPGDMTIAIGHPEDGAPWTLTTGAISNRLENLDGVPGKHVYQIQTPLNPGNSGGPLLNANGELVGVNTAAVKIGRSGLPVANIQFAIRSEVVRDFLKAVDAGTVAVSSSRRKVESQDMASGPQSIPMGQSGPAKDGVPLPPRRRGRQLMEATEPNANEAQEELNRALGAGGGRR